MDDNSKEIYNINPSRKNKNKKIQYYPENEADQQNESKNEVLNMSNNKEEILEESKDSRNQYLEPYIVHTA